MVLCDSEGSISSVSEKVTKQAIFCCVSTHLHAGIFEKHFSCFFKADKVDGVNYLIRGEGVASCLREGVHHLPTSLISLSSSHFHKYPLEIWSTRFPDCDISPFLVLVPLLYSATFPTSPLTRNILAPSSLTSPPSRFSKAREAQMRSSLSASKAT